MNYGCLGAVVLGFGLLYLINLVAKKWAKVAVLRGMESKLKREKKHE